MEFFTRNSWENILGRHTVPEENIVNGVIAPNRRSIELHTQHILTDTPHLELLGRNLNSKLPMAKLDDNTKTLVESLRDIDEKINSVSVSRNSVDLGIGFEHRGGRRLMKHIGSQALVLLQEHLELEEPLALKLRQQSEEELGRSIDLIILNAVRQGIAPPKGWNSVRRR